MPYPILPSVGGPESRHKTNLYTPSTLNYEENPVASQYDVSKVSTSLKKIKKNVY